MVLRYGRPVGLRRRRRCREAYPPRRGEPHLRISRTHTFGILPGWGEPDENAGVRVDATCSSTQGGRVAEVLLVLLCLVLPFLAVLLK